ncbi:DUF2269 family protein [Bacillus tuaregi]|uniref:DUF2269 family protein n=1 Tax=Bacillus tuaregi TaxID=1816695 RepID=UPI0008F93DDE|nr:DUF2269 family protein [Bacillus tuaregi]
MFYSLLLLLHVLAAIIGIGVTFAFPVISTMPQNLSQLKHTLVLMKRLEKYPQIGGAILIITGFIMGYLSPSYFKEIWFVGSIVLYIIVEFLIYVVIGAKMKKVMPVVMDSKGEEIPKEYKAVAKATTPIHMVVTLLAILIIVLMSVKPF